jgi:peptide subunit release factor 1 (eRF1)
MAKSTSALETPLREQLDRLAAFEPIDKPVLSLYLDMRPDEHGSRGRYENFLRKVFPERSRGLTGEARKSFDRDVERITTYLAEELQPSANGVAIVACSAANNFFEALQLGVPLDHSWLFVGSVPHLYPLARLNDQYPRYAALLLDTNSARLFVFGLGAAEARHEVRNVKTRKTSMGGWAQARYQRHIANFHLHHVKEVVDILDRVVRDESIGTIVVSCDPATLPTLMEQMPKHLAEKVVDVVHLDINTPEHQVLTETLEAMREQDAKTDGERVERLLNAWRSGGLGVVGPEDTLDALAKGQVEELIITATPELVRRAARLPVELRASTIDVDTSAGNANIDPQQIQFADELVTRAQQQSARIRFIEDRALLADVGGVGAILRFRI